MEPITRVQYVCLIIISVSLFSVQFGFSQTRESNFDENEFILVWREVTGIEVSKGDKIRIEARGRIELDCQNTFSPNGWPAGNYGISGKVVEGLKYGRLIALIETEFVRSGEKQTIIFQQEDIGHSNEFIALKKGELILQINSNVNESTGGAFGLKIFVNGEQIAPENKHEPYLIKNLDLDCHLKDIFFPNDGSAIFIQCPNKLLIYNEIGTRILDSIDLDLTEFYNFKLRSFAPHLIGVHESGFIRIWDLFKREALIDYVIHGADERFIERVLFDAYGEKMIVIMQDYINSQDGVQINLYDFNKILSSLDRSRHYTPLKDTLEEDTGRKTLNVLINENGEITSESVFPKNVLTTISTALFSPYENLLVVGGNSYDLNNDFPLNSELAGKLTGWRYNGMDVEKTFDINFNEELVDEVYFWDRDMVKIVLTRSEYISYIGGNVTRFRSVFLDLTTFKIESRTHQKKINQEEENSAVKLLPSGYQLMAYHPANGIAIIKDRSNQFKIVDYDLYCLSFRCE